MLFRSQEMNGESGHFEKVTYNPKASFVPTDSAKGAPVEGGSDAAPRQRSEERRVGKECRSRWSPYHSKKQEIPKSGYISISSIVDIIVEINEFPNYIVQ